MVAGEAAVEGGSCRNRRLRTMWDAAGQDGATMATAAVSGGEVISGREIQGDHDVVISPSRRLDFRNDSKSNDPLRIWRSKKRTKWRMTSRRIIRSPEGDVTPGYGLPMNGKLEIFSVRRVED